MFGKNLEWKIFEDKQLFRISWYFDLAVTCHFRKSDYEIINFRDIYIYIYIYGLILIEGKWSDHTEQSRLRKIAQCRKITKVVCHLTFFSRPVHYLCLPLAQVSFSLSQFWCWLLELDSDKRWILYILNKRKRLAFAFVLSVTLPQSRL